MDSLRFLRQNAAFLGAGFLLTLTSCLGQTFFISVFAGEVQSEFNLGHGAWGGLYLLSTMASAIVMVWAGTLTDVVRARVLAPMVLTLLAVACIGFATANSLWQLALSVFALRLAGQGMAGHIAAVAMTRWFASNRGRALAFAGLGYSVGEALLPMIFVALKEHLSWRTLWMISAGLSLVVIPILSRLLRLERTPQSLEETTESCGIGGHHWERRAVLRHALFWLAVPALIVPPTFGTAFFFHQVHLAEVTGLGHGRLVALFPAFTGTAILSMLSSGWALDRFGAARLIPLWLLPGGLGFLALGWVPGIGGAAMGVVLLGVTAGGMATLPNAFWAEAYGTRYVGGIKALGTAGMVFGSALGPGLTGAFIDLGWPFLSQSPAIAATYVLAAVLLMIGVKTSMADK